MSHFKATDGVRKLYKYRGANLYVMLFWDEDRRPCDLIVSVSSEEMNLDPLTLANLDGMAAMTSLSLREHEPIYVFGKLSKASRSKDDLPAIFADMILEHGVGNG